MWLRKVIFVHLQEDGISGQAKESQDDKSDVAQLFKIAKQLGMWYLYMFGKIITFLIVRYILINLLKQTYLYCLSDSTE